MSNFAVRLEDREDPLTELKRIARELHRDTSTLVMSQHLPFFGTLYEKIDTSDPELLIMAKALQTADGTLSEFARRGEYLKLEKSAWAARPAAFPYFQTAEEVGSALKTAINFIRQRDLWNLQKLAQFEQSVQAAEALGLFDTERLAKLKPQRPGPAG